MTSRISGRSKGVQQFAEAMSGNINENIGHGFDVSYSFSDIKISFSSRVFFEHGILGSCFLFVPIFSYSLTAEFVSQSYYFLKVSQSSFIRHDELSK